jgi:hypothetical protein
LYTKHGIVKCECSLTMQKHHIVLIFIIATILLCALTAYGKFFYVKDYMFYIETTCDPAVEKCFVRDCTADECPPNMLTNYKSFNIRASDFLYCTEGNCTEFCEASDTAKRCEQIVCDSQTEACSI